MLKALYVQLSKSMRIYSKVDLQSAGYAVIENVPPMIKEGGRAMKSKIAICSSDIPDKKHLIVHMEEEVFGGSDLNVGEELTHVSEVVSTSINVAEDKCIVPVEHQSALHTPVVHSCNLCNKAPS